MSGIEEYHTYQRSLSSALIMHPGPRSGCPCLHPGYEGPASHRYRAAPWLPWTMHEGSLADCEVPHPQCSPGWTQDMDAAWLAGEATTSPTLAPHRGAQLRERSS